MTENHSDVVEFNRSLRTSEGTPIVRGCYRFGPSLINRSLEAAVLFDECHVPSTCFKHLNLSNIATRRIHQNRCITLARNRAFQHIRWNR